MTMFKRHRSDNALTQDVMLAIGERLKTKQPLVKRGHAFLLLNGQNWANKIPVGTYCSWVRRNTIPRDSKDNRGFNDLLKEMRHKITIRKVSMLEKLTADDFQKLIKMKETIKTERVSINKYGEPTSIRTVEKTDFPLLGAKLKALTALIDYSMGKADGRHLNAKKEVLRFSLGDLRKIKNDTEQFATGTRNSF